MIGRLSKPKRLAVRRRAAPLGRLGDVPPEGLQRGGASVAPASPPAKGPGDEDIAGTKGGAGLGRACHREPAPARDATIMEVRGSLFAGGYQHAKAG